LKIAIIGGGSTYTPELIDGFIMEKNNLSIDEISLMDIEPERLKILGDFCRRMLARERMKGILKITSDLEEAVRSASFIITQIRVGGNKARLLDEKIPLEFDCIGQETTGAGGFSHALRAIPHVMEIARFVEVFSPLAWVINFTNPSGLITEALSNYSSIKVVGLCNVPMVMQHKIAEILNTEPEKITLDYFGLNHLSWIKKVNLDGRDATEEILKNIDKIDILKDIDPRLVRKMKMIPSPYLKYYYHSRDALRKQKSSLSRAEEVLNIEERLLAIYSNPQVDTKPPLLSERGGALYSTAAIKLIKALASEKPQIQIVNTLNRGAIPGIDGSSIVEIPAEISSKGIKTLPRGSIPQPAMELIQKIKKYEILTIQAVMEGSALIAVDALKMHPLIGSEKKAWSILARIVESHENLLPDSFKKGLKDRWWFR